MTVSKPANLVSRTLGWFLAVSLCLGLALSPAAQAAAKAGIRVGDLLLSVAGLKLDVARDLSMALIDMRPGKRVAVSAMRGGWPIEPAVALEADTMAVLRIRRAAQGTLHVALPLNEQAARARRPGASRRYPRGPL